MLYVGIASFESLMEEAEDALDREAHDEALDYLRRAETVFPDDPALLVLCYAIFQRSGRPEEAEEYSRRLQEIGLVNEKIVHGEYNPTGQTNLKGIYSVHETQ